ncbi:Ras-specific guanine nucleotide-releasing factor 2, partial [Paragonimus heterotremus]
YSLEQHCFAIYYKKEGVRQYELRAETEEECNAWMEAIDNASFGKLLERKQEAEQKQLHLLQILDTERKAKWQYVKQTEELAAEVTKLKLELNEYRSDKQTSPELVSEAEELKKIKKVQSFFRGWLCRRRWKQIVDEYIRSEHAESMRKRNSIVFGLVECEDEYVQQLSILVTCYLRPFRMAASSKKPIMTHEDVNSIFLNVETLLFLHQFFVQGLRNKMENWPTLQLGDLFDLFLPMIGIYQEYVRNHHYSLQVLAEYKQRPEFTQMLKRLEDKPLCEGRSIESFLTYPMHQIPRYIITLHELLAHTPHDHVDRKKLEYAKSKLEQISHVSYVWFFMFRVSPFNHAYSRNCRA